MQAQRQGFKETSCILQSEKNADNDKALVPRGLNIDFDLNCIQFWFELLVIDNFRFTSPLEYILN